MIFTVNGSVAHQAVPISLADAGLKERQHLQEWVIAHPEVLGAGMLIVTAEFGSWLGSSGEKERDRLDVLALNRDGVLCVVELKRDKAPDTVEMQALKYAALASRFTKDRLDRAHAAFLTQVRGEPVSVEQSAAALDAWAVITEASLAVPSVVLMASSFPATVTATVVFLHQRLGLDIRLVQFQAYRTGAEVLLSVSQHYPPPGIEDFVLTPEVAEAKKAKEAKVHRGSEDALLQRLVASSVVALGAELTFEVPAGEDFDVVTEWLLSESARGCAVWSGEMPAPLTWQVDGKRYSPTALARLIVERASGGVVDLDGASCWVDSEGESLRVLAGSNVRPVITFVEFMALGSPELVSVGQALNEGLCDLLGFQRQRVNEACANYYGVKRVAEIIRQKQHLSVYVYGPNATTHVVGGVIQTVTAQYVRTQVQSSSDVAEVVGLVRAALVAQQR